MIRFMTLVVGVLAALIMLPASVATTPGRGDAA